MDYSPSQENRFVNIENWLEWGEARYDVLLSRSSELASLAGWDDSPRVRLCEHKWEWRRHNLCMMCDNTGWRKCHKDDERAIDPMSLGVSAVKGGFYAKSAGDESTAQKLAASIARLSQIIAELERQRLQRADEEAAPDKAMQLLISLVGDTLDKAPRSYRKIMLAVHDLSARAPVWANRLPDRSAIILLSALIPGRVEPCHF